MARSQGKHITIQIEHEAIRTLEEQREQALGNEHSTSAQAAGEMLSLEQALMLVGYAK